MDSLTSQLTAAKSDADRMGIFLRLSNLYSPDSIAKKFYYANEALYIAERNNREKGIMQASVAMAICYVNVWELQEAIDLFNKGIRNARQVKDEQTERVCWQYLVHCYDHLELQKKALYCQAYLLTLTMKTGDAAAICRQMSALATCLFDADSKEEGIAWLNKAIKLAMTILHGDTKSSISAELLNTLSTLYMKVEKTDSALLCLRTALPLAASINDTPNIAYVFSSYCDAYVAARQYDSARYYGEATIAWGKTFNDLPLLQNYYRILADVYEKEKYSGKAIQYYKIADSIKEAINASEQTHRHAMQLSKVAMKQQIMHREEEKKKYETVKRNHQLLIGASLVVLVILFIVTLSVFRNLKNKTRSHKIIREQADNLQKQNRVIDTALKEKEVLIQETHHRVKNNLQLVNSLLELQIADSDDGQIKDALRTVQQRIHSIAMVHSRLYHDNESSEGIDLKSFIEDLYGTLHGAFSGMNKNIRFNALIPENSFELSTLVPLGLILNELITNSFKHAFAGREEGNIQIKLVRVNGIISLIYSDDGNGMEQEYYKKKQDSLGLYLIQRLAKQLKGNVTYANQSGSIFTITFPDETNQNRNSGG